MEFLLWYQFRGVGFHTQAGVVGAGLPKAASSEPAPTESVGVNQHLGLYQGKNLPFSFGVSEWTTTYTATVVKIPTFFGVVSKHCEYPYTQGFFLHPSQAIWKF